MPGMYINLNMCRSHCHHCLITQSESTLWHVRLHLSGCIILALPLWANEYSVYVWNCATSRRSRGLENPTKKWMVQKHTVRSSIAIYCQLNLYSVISIVLSKKPPSKQPSKAYLWWLLTSSLVLVNLLLTLFVHPSTCPSATLHYSLLHFKRFYFHSNLLVLAIRQIDPFSAVLLITTHISIF